MMPHKSKKFKYNLFSKKREWQNVQVCEKGLPFQAILINNLKWQKIYGQEKNLF